MNLRPYTAELPSGSLSVGVDNIHHDVYLSPQWSEQTRNYLLEIIRQMTNLTYLVQNEHRRGKPKSPEPVAFKRQLLELLQASLTRAKYEKKVELDLLLRVALVQFLTQEINNQFSSLLLEAKEWIRNRGEYFERSEQAHVMKARLAELQADRRNIYRQVGQHIHQVLVEIEENHLARARHALFGDEQSGAYELLLNRLIFAQGGRDDVLFVEQYVLLGNYQRDEDRFETVDEFFSDFLWETLHVGESNSELSAAQKAHRQLMDSALAAREELARLQELRGTLSRRVERGRGVLARVGIASDTGRAQSELATADARIKQIKENLETLGARIEAAKIKASFLADGQKALLGDYLNEPENARRLFDAKWSGSDLDSAESRDRRLDAWLTKLEQSGLFTNILASYQLRNFYHDYCPPVHLQQLRKALVSREEFERVARILDQFPARGFSLQRIDAAAKVVRRYPRDEAKMVALRFAEDFMRLRRDLRNYEKLTAAMERVQLVRSEHTREVSRMNNSLYEFLLPSEAPPAQDNVVNHVVVKADVRGSTKITRDLLARGLNPATLFSLNFYEPVKRILESYGAAKVFIEGDAMVLAIFETESNRSHQRAVSKACALARQILAIAAAYNDRAETDANELPRLELGVGVAFQGSAPAYWVDSDSRIMISRALNLSDRLSSCSKVARRLLADKISLFRLFVFQPGMEGAQQEEEADEFLIRFNLNGIELNDEGFAKLSEEIALQEVEAECEMPWGRERTTFFFGNLPLGETLEPILLRRGYIRQMLPDGRIGAASPRAYYEVCSHPKAFELVEALLLSVSHRA